MALSCRQSASHARVAGSVRRVVVLGLVFGSIGLHAQTDPGVRVDATPAVGGMLPGLSPAQQANFADGLANFITVRSLKGTEGWA